MKVCVLNEDEAWHVEHDGIKPDCRFHRHWTATKAIDEIAANRAIPARRNGDPSGDVIPDTVVLLSAKEEKRKSKAIAFPWEPKMSEGYRVWQFITEA